MTLRLAVLTDFPEEGWPSMDLCADMLLAHLPPVAAGRVCPPFRRILTGWPGMSRRNAAFNAERLLNRFILYPRTARRLVGSYDAFHIVDHTYSQLVLSLPSERTGVYCHDLDAFRCLIEPHRDPRPRWFRAMASRILAGFQRAAIVFHNTRAVADEILRWNLIPSHRLIHAPLAPAPEFVANGPAEEGAYLLHVGSCVPRKRVDVLLRVYEQIQQHQPDLQLIQAGGRFAPHLQEYARRLGVRQVRNLSREQLATLYRGACAVLVPSDAEGFGLPVLEALACGTPVVASDIPALREVGGEVVRFCPVGEVSAWVETVRAVIRQDRAHQRGERLSWAGRFSWTAHARIVAEAYHKLIGS